MDALLITGKELAFLLSMGQKDARKVLLRQGGRQPALPLTLVRFFSSRHRRRHLMLEQKILTAEVVEAEEEAERGRHEAPILPVHAAACRGKTLHAQPAP